MRCTTPTALLYGRLPDYHLSELGREMADAGRRRPCADHDIVHLRCSPLERAQETMAAASPSALDLPVITDGRVIEAENRLEGSMVVASARTRSSAAQPRNWWLFRNPLSPTWGERYTEIVARMRLAMRDAAEAAAGHEAVDRLPPAADLDGPLRCRGPPAGPRPAQARVHAGQRHLVHLHRRPGHLGRLHRAGRGPVRRTRRSEKFVAGA